MLEIQRYLIKNSLQQLQDEYSIKVTKHEDGRRILNYHQIDSYSKRFDPIVRECRGLVLDKDNVLVARAFKRFFNLGEYCKEQDNFQWENSYSAEKVDGSLILIYYWQGSWHVNTRGSFGAGNINNTPMTWHQLVDLALPKDWRKKLDPQYTYVGEICSRYNKVVRDYKKPVFFLLTMFLGSIELDHAAVDYYAKECGLLTPDTYNFIDTFDVVKFLDEKALKEPTFEGVVIRDVNNKRLKAKSPTYVELHHMSSNGNIAMYKNLVPIYFKGEIDEVIQYFPEIADKLYEVKNKIEASISEIDNLWHCYHDEKNRKRFALAVKHHPLAALLFQARDQKCHPKDLLKLDKSQELVLKILFHE